MKICDICFTNGAITVKKLNMELCPKCIEAIKNARVKKILYERYDDGELIGVYPTLEQAIRKYKPIDSKVVIVKEIELISREVVKDEVIANNGGFEDDE